MKTKTESAKKKMAVIIQQFANNIFGQFEPKCFVIKLCKSFAVLQLEYCKTL